MGPTIGTLMRIGVFSRIRHTPAISVDPSAAVEVHSLVCHRDLDLYLLAIKSLLRFEARLAVVVHDDGTLTEADRAMIERHLSGVEVIGRVAADAAVGETLRHWPECRRFRATRATAPQLFDFSLLARRKRLISLDSDIVFARVPSELLAWISAPRRDVLYNQEPGGTQIGRTMRRLGIPCHGDLNSGFFAYHRDMINLAVVESHLSRLEGEPKSGYSQGYLDACLHWSPYLAVPLPPERYAVYTGQRREAVGEAVMVHFISYLRYAQFHYPRLAMQVIRSLRRQTSTAQALSGAPGCFTPFRADMKR
jgi:hypothetical protein